MALLRDIYEAPTAIDREWGHQRIFAQSAYKAVREARFVPIVMAEAQDLGRWFPVCWVRGEDGAPELAAFRTLLADGRGFPADVFFHGDGLPLVLQAFPLVVPDAESLAARKVLADRTIPDRPTDIGAPLLTENGHFSPATLTRAKIAATVAAGMAPTRDFSHILDEKGFLKPWDVNLDLGHGQRASFSNLAILDTDRLDDPVLHKLIVEFGVEAALLVAAHRLSLFRMSALLNAARRDVQRGLEQRQEMPQTVELP